MRKSILAVATATSIQLLAGTAVAQTIDGYEDGDLLSSQQINESGGIKLQAEGLGAILITELRNERAPDHDCLMYVPALIAEMREMRQMPRGVAVTVELQAFTVTDSRGNTTIMCEGGGTGCTATVELAR